MKGLFFLFSKLKNLIHKHYQFVKNNSDDAPYKICGIIENYKGTGEVYAAVLVKITGKKFHKSIKQLYSKDWFDSFNKEDIAFLSFVYAAEQSNNLQIIKYFPIKKHRVTKSVIILGMLFVVFLILSNLTAFKICELNISGFLWMKPSENYHINFPAALLIFPLTYFFDNVLTEVYGFKLSRLIIWVGLICNTIFQLIAWMMVFVPYSPEWNIATHGGQEAFRQIFSGSWIIFFASTIGYFCGEFLNSVILSKLKILTSGKYFFLRVIGSTAVGVGVDSFLFCSIAFYWILPYDMIMKLIFTQYVFKLSYEIMMLPVTYYLTDKLKKWDEVDYYDFQTDYNPFSMSLEDKEEK